MSNILKHYNPRMYWFETLWYDFRKIVKDCAFHSKMIGFLALQETTMKAHFIPYQITSGNWAIMIKTGLPCTVEYDGSHTASCTHYVFRTELQESHVVEAECLSQMLEFLGNFCCQIFRSFLLLPNFPNSHIQLHNNLGLWPTVLKKKLWLKW